MAINNIYHKTWIDTTECPYAIYVHEGTSKMVPRPFLRGTLDDNRDKIEKIITSSMKKSWAAIAFKKV